MAIKPLRLNVPAHKAAGAGARRLEAAAVRADEAHSAVAPEDDARRGKTLRLKEKHASSLAYGQASSLGMSMFMMYMMGGGGLSVFTLMFVGRAVMAPVQNLRRTREAFARFADPRLSLAQPMAIYVIINIAGLGFALYRCAKMGLLPSGADLAMGLGSLSASGHVGGASM